MLRLKAERRSLAKVSGASASESLKTPDIAHCTRTHKRRHPRTYEAPLRTWTDLIAFVLFVALAVAAVFIAGYMLIAALFVISQMVTG